MMQMNIAQGLSRFCYRLLMRLIAVYQMGISPLLPARCRYHPTCSTYAKQALTWHGVLRGSYLSLHRICRCHPWGGHGIDFVPLPLYRWQYHIVDAAVRLCRHPPYYHEWGFGVLLDAYSYRRKLNSLLKNS